ncbi:MAG: hypothetical protein WAN03_18605 [Candidatus Sulfotelmatobacter sp.]
MERAKQELEAGDVTLAILLSSMAVEGETAFLFFKWKGIDAMKLPLAVTEARCFSLAWALLKLFHAMDRRACELLDNAQRAFNSQADGSPMTLESH